MSAIIGKNVISGAAFAFSHLETAWKVTPNFCASSSWLNPLFFLYFNIFAAKTIFTFFNEKYHLTKPTILRTIDYINEHTNRKISYRNYCLEDLLKSLKDGDFNE